MPRVSASTPHPQGAAGGPTARALPTIIIQRGAGWGQDGDRWHGPAPNVPAQLRGRIGGRRPQSAQPRGHNSLGSGWPWADAEFQTLQWGFVRSFPRSLYCRWLTNTRAAGFGSGPGRPPLLVRLHLRADPSLGGEGRRHHREAAAGQQLLSVCRLETQETMPVSVLPGRTAIPRPSVTPRPAAPTFVSTPLVAAQSTAQGPIRGQVTRQRPGSHPCAPLGPAAPPGSARWVPARLPGRGGALSPRHLQRAQLSDKSRCGDGVLRAHTEAP